MRTEGISNLDFAAEESLEFIPSTAAVNAQRAARRGHVIAFCGGVFAGITALLALQWMTRVLFAVV